MIKKTKDKLFYCGKAHQLLSLLAEISNKNITVKEYLQTDLKKG